MTAAGPFDVKLTPQPPGEDVVLGRFALDKEFRGDLLGTSKGQMLAFGMALILGFIATRLKLPSLVGYMLAGIVIGLPILATLFLSLYRVCIPWPRPDTGGAAAYVLEHRAEPEPVTANQWEYEYYFRNLNGMFYPKLRLLQEKNQPSRYWIVLTSDDRAFATKLAESLHNSQILERREFLKATVMLIANDIN